MTKNKDGSFTQVTTGVPGNIGPTYHETKDHDGNKGVGRTADESRKDYQDNKAKNKDK